MIVQMDTVVGNLVQEQEALKSGIETKEVKFKKISSSSDVGDNAMGEAVLEEISKDKYKQNCYN